MPDLTHTYLQLKPKLPKTLYHYCSTEAFLSIIQNKCIWLSDADSTNDATELKYVFNNFKDVLNETLEGIDSKYDAQKELIRIHCLKVMNNLISKKVPATKYTKQFLCCFSEAKDLLSQWRAYADDGRGVAIGFDSQMLSNIICDETYGFTKVIYQEKIAREFLHTSLDSKLIYMLESYIKEDISDEDAKMFLVELATIVFSIWQEGFVFKHRSFKEEREWRIYKKTSISNYNEDEGVDDYGYAGFLDGVFSANDKYMGEFTRSKLKYRATSNNIRPYFEIGFDKCKEKIIKEIVLGPKCDISELNLKLLLAQNEYIDDVSSDKIKIINSNSPYV